MAWLSAGPVEGWVLGFRGLGLGLRSGSGSERTGGYLGFRGLGLGWIRECKNEGTFGA